MADTTQEPVEDAVGRRIRELEETVTYLEKRVEELEQRIAHRASSSSG